MSENDKSSLIAEIEESFSSSLSTSPQIQVRVVARGCRPCSQQQNTHAHTLTLFSLLLTTPPPRIMVHRTMAFSYFRTTIMQCRRKRRPLP
jgi:hypothetical protein